MTSIKRESAKIPNVLVISSSPFSQTTNNGKTLSSFFENYPKSKISQLSFSSGKTNNNVCDNYFILSNHDVLHNKEGLITKKIIENSQEENTKNSFLKRVFHFFSKRRTPITVFLKNYAWKKRKNYKLLFNWIEDFSPDIIFFQGFSQAYGYDVVKIIYEKYNIPLILELTDDYTMNLFPLSIISYYNQREYIQKLKNIINYSSKTLVISEKMKLEYENKFDQKMDVMINSISKQNLANEKADIRNPNDIVYAGSLNLNRWKTIVKISKALNKINSEMIISIYSSLNPNHKIVRNIIKYDNIQYCGFLEKQELEKRLKKSGYVIHAESFDKKNKKITRLSLSTKISEYVASGATIIAVGPKNIASMETIEQYKLGICIYDQKIRKIKISLKKGLDNFQDDIDNKMLFLKKHASENNAKKIKKHLIKFAKK